MQCRWCPYIYAWDIHCVSKLPVWFGPSLTAMSRISFKHLPVKKRKKGCYIWIRVRSAQYLWTHLTQFLWYLGKNIALLKNVPKISLLLQVILVSANKLTRYIEPCQLTEDFGGSLTYDHMDWLNKRLVGFLFLLLFLNISFLSHEVFV